MRTKRLWLLSNVRILWSINKLVALANYIAISKQPFTPEMIMFDLEKSWSGTLKNDLQGFADPKTDVCVKASGSKITATWLQRGKEQQAEFQLSPDGDFRWIPSDAEGGRTYRKFLGSAELADFNQLANAIIRTSREVEHYVPTQGKLDNDGTSTPTTMKADELILQRSAKVLSEPPGRTQMLFLKGDAGSGKTTLLREVAKEQARRFIGGQSDFLYLYVSAQGRALSNLRDALSGELDDLRAGFTRDAVPPLVRQGLVVPIIDGFDELLGAAGYGDAFGSLHQFLEQLDGRGTLIVSARSSFYDIEFLEREPTDGKRSAYEIEPVTLLPWGDGEIFQYLAHVRGLRTAKDEDRSAVDALSDGDRELLAKPFFASLFKEYVDSPAEYTSGVTLRDYLVGSYVRRESSKIVDRDGRPLLDTDGHRKIFEFIAEEMWSWEKRDFSADDLRTAAELIADEVKLAGDSAKQLITKITSYAGFSVSQHGQDRRFQFEHEVYFDHFLSQALHRRLTSADKLGSFLDGGLLPEEVVSAVVDSGNAQQWLNLLDDVQRNMPQQESRRRNIGTLAVVCFRSVREIANCSIRLCNFVNTSFGDAKFESVMFEDCQFIGVRLDRATFKNCRVENCTASRLAVACNSHLGITGLIPGQNLYSLVDVGKSEEVHSPSDMRRLLHRSGVPGMEEEASEVAYSANAQKHIALLQRIVSKYQKTNRLCLEDNLVRPIVQDRTWSSLRELLVNHQIVSEETPQASGTKKTFLRRCVDLSALMQMEQQSSLPDGPLGDFWRALRECE